MPRVPNQRKEYTAHYNRVERYASLLDGIYKQADNEFAKLALSINHDPAKPFKWVDYPQIKKKVDALLKGVASNIEGVIINGATAEWEESNFKNDRLARSVIDIKKFDKDDKGRSIIPERFKPYFNNNADALQSFISRKQKGLNLSQKVWKLSEQYKDDLELALSVGLSDGRSATELSRDIRQYLQEPKKLFRRVMQDDKLRLSKPAKAYHPGQGVYRSSYKNAMRLTRTEINMAYRTADSVRWGQMDFIVGFEVKRSGRGYDCSVCSAFAGKYPKDFKFVGWHPHCRCYVIPILKTDEEFWAWDGRGNAPTDSVNKVTDVPQGYKDWIGSNRERIAQAKERGTLPYFLRDNREYATRQLSELSIDEIKQKIDLNNKIITEDIFCVGGEYSDYRKSLHKSIVDKYTSDDFSTGGDTVYMLGGPPANGKSTLVESGMLPHPKGVLVIDPDSVKSRIPEYRNMLSSGNTDLIEKAANFVHEESSYLGKKIRKEAFAKDINVVLDGINDGSIDKIKQNASLIRELTGKRIRSDYCTLDTDLSVKLAQERAARTGRTVPLDYVKSVNKELSSVFEDIIKNNVFDELYLWDTNINGEPRLILKQIDGKVHIESRELYARFLSKGKK